MPITHGRNLYFGVTTPSGGSLTPLTTYTREVSGLPGEQELGDVTVAGNVGYSQFPGLQRVAFSSVHVLETSTTATTAWATLDEFQSLQQTYPSTPWGVHFGPRGSTAGYPLIFCNAFIRSVALPARVTDPNVFTVNWEMTAGTTGVTIGVFT